MIDIGSQSFLPITNILLFFPSIYFDYAPVLANALTITSLFVILIDARGWSNVLALRKNRQK